MIKTQKTAEELHKDVPPDWYYRSIKENKLQNYWHNRRFAMVSSMIERVNGGLVLDIGSADGVFSKVILDISGAKKLIGIDVLKSSVAWANKHWKKNKKMSFRVADAHNLPFRARTFDAVFALEVLEHVHNPDKVLKEIKRVLKKGGYAIFLVPTESLLFKFIWFFWTKFRGKIWSGTHIQDYNHDGLVDTCRNAGFEIVQNNKFILGMLQAVKVRKR